MPKISSFPSSAFASTSYASTSHASPARETSGPPLPKASSSNTNPYRRTFRPRHSEAVIKKKIDDAPIDIFAIMGSTPMVGNKRSLLKLDELRMPLLAALNSEGYSRFVDAFAGTGSVSMYVHALDELPSGSVINELDDLRHADLYQSINHSEAVIQELQNHGQNLRKLCYRILNDLPADADVAMDEVAAWEEKRNEARDITMSHSGICAPEVQKYLLQELEKNWDPNDSGPQNNPKTAALSKLLQFNAFRNVPVEIKWTINDEGSSKLKLLSGLAIKMFNEPYTGNGGIRILDTIEKLAVATEKMATNFANTQVTKTDGFKLHEIAKSGDVFFVDPPYLRTPHDIKRGQGTRYDAHKEGVYDIEHLKSLIAELEKTWEKGAHIVMTNRWDHDLSRLLVSRGWRVSPPVQTRTIWEMVATNFDWEGGTGAIRQCQHVSPYRLLAEAKQGTEQQVQCDLQSGAKLTIEQKEGVVIGKYFYTEINGYLTRFEPKTTSRKSSRITSIVPDASTIWQKSVDQKDLPELIDYDSWSAPLTDTQTQKKLSKSGKKIASTVARLYSRGGGFQAAQVSSSNTESVGNMEGPSRPRRGKRVSEQARIPMPGTRHSLPRKAKARNSGKEAEV